MNHVTAKNAGDDDDDDNDAVQSDAVRRRIPPQHETRPETLGVRWIECVALSYRPTT